MTGQAGTRTPEARLVRRALREGWALTDAQFDGIYPDWVRALSDPHWTPIAVARRAAALLAVAPGARILDVGAGAGKLCVIGALTTGATFVGIEQREGLVAAARQAARDCGAAGAEFLHGDMMSLDWGRFSGIYLFNPFYEHITSRLPTMEEPIDLSRAHYGRSILGAYRQLSAAPPGTRVVTYHGYGGPLPPGYRLVVHEPAGCDYLNLWQKDSPGPAPGGREDPG